MKCKIIATEEELMLIGMDPIMAKSSGTWLKDYPDGFCEVSFSGDDLIPFLATSTYSVEYDIPKKWLKFD